MYTPLSLEGGSMAGSPPPASPGGALSREQLYAPLTDYLPGGAPLGGAPAASASAASASAASASAASASAAAASALRIHPSVRESALAEHLAAVSAAYVSDPALGGAGTRGNGGTSVDRRAMASRIRQRSLQLVGGGLLTGTAAAADVVDWGRSPEPGANFSPPGPGGAVGASRRSRRRRRAERGTRPYGSCSGTRRRRREEELLRGGKGGTGPPLDGPADTAALLALNGMWCQYVRSLLGLEEQEENDGTARGTDGARPPLVAVPGSQYPRTQSRLSEVLGGAEAIGSYVRIVRCAAALSYVGEEGVVVSDSRNAWRVAVARPAGGGSTADGKKTSGDGGGGEGSSSVPSASPSEPRIRWRVRVVPKRGSELAYRIDVLERKGGAGGHGGGGREGNRRMSWYVSMKQPTA